MAKRASSAPISTNLSASGGNTNLPWTTWFRETSDTLVSATKNEVKDNCNYTIIGQICFISINATIANGKIALPFNSLFAKKIQVFLNGSSTPVYYDLSADSAELNVDAGSAVVISDWYVVKLNS